MSSDERASGPSEIESDHGESDNEESERASSNSLFSLSSMPSLSSTPELQELNKARDDAREPTAEERNAELRQLVEEEEQRTARLEELTRVLGGDGEDVTQDFLEEHVEHLKAQIKSEKQKASDKMRALAQALTAQAERIDTEYRGLQRRILGEEATKERRKSGGRRREGVREALEVAGLFTYAALLIANPDAPPALTREAHMWEKMDEGRLQLIQAPLDELINILCLGRDHALAQAFDWDEYCRIFLLTYARFTEATRLMKTLHFLFMERSGQPDQRTVLEVVQTWAGLEQGADFADGTAPKPLLEAFAAFCDSVDAIPQWRPSARLLRHVPHSARLYCLASRFTSATGKAPAPILPQGSQASWTLADMDPLEVARQLTLMAQASFRGIPRREFLHGGWYARDPTERTRLSPKLIQYVAESNRLSRWIATEILKRRANEARAQLIEYFIVLAQHLRALNNFEGLMQVLSALHSSAIAKIKRAWVLVSKKSQESCERLTELMSNLGHYKNYYEVFNALDPSAPAIPLLSVVLQDLFLLDDVMSDMNEDGWINWKKMASLGRQVSQVSRRRLPHVLQEVQAVQDFIREAEVWSDEDILYEVASLLDQSTSHESPHVASRRPRKPYYSTYDLWDKSEPDNEELLALCIGLGGVKLHVEADTVLEGEACVWRVLSGAVIVGESGSTDFSDNNDKNISSHTITSGWLGEAIAFIDAPPLLFKATVPTDLVRVPVAALHGALQTGDAEALLTSLTHSLAWKLRQKAARQSTLTPRALAVTPLPHEPPLPSELVQTLACEQTQSGIHASVLGALHICTDHLVFRSALFGHVHDLSWPLAQISRIQRSGPTLKVAVRGENGTGATTIYLTGFADVAHAHALLAEAIAAKGAAPTEHSERSDDSPTSEALTPLAPRKSPPPASPLPRMPPLALPRTASPRAQAVIRTPRSQSPRSPLPTTWTGNWSPATPRSNSRGSSDNIIIRHSRSNTGPSSPSLNGKFPSGESKPDASNTEHDRTPSEDSFLTVNSVSSPSTPRTEQAPPADGAPSPLVTSKTNAGLQETTEAKEKGDNERSTEVKGERSTKVKVNGETATLPQTEVEASQNAASEAPAPAVELSAPVEENSARTVKAQGTENGTTTSEHEEAKSDTQPSQEGQAEVEELPELRETEPPVPPQPTLPLPSADEWALLLKGAATVSYRIGQTLVKRGNDVGQLIQVARGRVHTKRGGRAGAGEHGGLVALVPFVLGREASASIVAETECVVNLLEGFYLNILFSHYPDLSTKFDAYLGLELARMLLASDLA